MRHLGFGQIADVLELWLRGMQIGNALAEGDQPLRGCLWQQRGDAREVFAGVKAERWCWS